MHTKTHTKMHCQMQHLRLCLTQAYAICRKKRVGVASELTDTSIYPTYHNIREAPREKMGDSIQVPLYIRDTYEMQPDAADCR